MKLLPADYADTDDSKNKKMRILPLVKKTCVSWERFSGTFRVFELMSCLMLDKVAFERVNSDA
jgi:hypothetical protein